jgi:hypothetical protein
MYEEEDDDLPTQYQRLNAHLQTSSWLFNRKLHDYIATQHGVRNMFLHQQFPGMQTYAAPMQQNSQAPFMNASMLPPQTFNPATQGFAQSPQPYNAQAYQQQQPQPGYRQAPYNIPQRAQPHQRSASIATPQAVQGLGLSTSPVDATATSPSADNNRRMSLPPHALEQASQKGSEVPSRPSLSRSSNSPVSPQQLSASTSGPATPVLKSEQTTPTSYQFPSLPFNTSSQVLQMNPLSFSLPPESQQFVGSVLDPNDPRTASLMAGSENLPQPFMGTYTYNPNFSPKAALNRAAGDKSTNAFASGMTQTLVPEDSMIKMERSADGATSHTPPSSMMDNTYTPNQMFSPNGFDYTNYFDQYSSAEANRTLLSTGTSRALPLGVIVHTYSFKYLIETAVVSLSLSLYVRVSSSWRLGVSTPPFPVCSLLDTILDLEFQDTRWEDTVLNCLCLRIKRTG